MKNNPTFLRKVILTFKVSSDLSKQWGPFSNISCTGLLIGVFFFSVVGYFFLFVIWSLFLILFSICPNHHMLYCNFRELLLSLHYTSVPLHIWFTQLEITLLLSSLDVWVVIILVHHQIHWLNVTEKVLFSKFPQLFVFEL